MSSEPTKLETLTSKFNSPSDRGDLTVMTILLTLVGVFIIVSGIIIISIYNELTETEKKKVVAEYQAGAVAVGLGVGILSYLLLYFISKVNPDLPLILLSLLFIVVGIGGLSSTTTPEVFSGALIGLGVGLFISFLFTTVKFITFIERIRLLVILFSVFLIIFPIIGLVEYNTSGKPEKLKNSTYYLYAIGAIAVILLIAASLSYIWIPFNTGKNSK